MNQFAGPIAQHYAITRYMPPCESINLVTDAINEIRHTTRIRAVADVGCGTGRFLKALASIDRISYVHGYDISEDMLAQFVNEVQSPSPHIQLHLADCSTHGSLPPERFDLIVLHWVLNTTSAWSDILENCARAVNEGGGLFWLEETSSLYDAIDRRELGMSANSEILNVFWQEFYIGLGSWGEQTSLQKRKGLSMDSDISRIALSQMGFAINTLSDKARCWSASVTLEWLVRFVLLPKAFSNFWQIPDDAFHRGLSRVYSLLQRYPRATRQPIHLRYRAVPVIAVKC